MWGVEMSGQAKAVATFPPVKDPPVPIK
jgi:hypothetical protein